MRLEKVKMNRHNRVKILCSYCDTLNHENETYADLDTKFHYICHKCAMYMCLEAEEYWVTSAPTEPHKE